MNNLAGKERIHALDNLRAIMMWLGIVLHVSINHLSGPSQMPWKDPQATPVADLLLVFIHAFRMPVFFILAGYLASNMAASGGVDAMVRNRARRIALPFVIFWPVLFVLTGGLVLAYIHLAARGTIGFDLAVAPKQPRGGVLLETMHMWFIYYLFWFCMLAALMCTARGALRRAWQAGWDSLLTHWWGLVLLALPLAAAGAGYRAGMLTPSGSFIPDVREMVHSGVFFAFGWQLFRHRATLLPRFSAHYRRYLLAGLATFAVTLDLFAVFFKAPASIAHLEACIAFTYGLTSWLWSVGLLGLFLRHMNRQNAVLRYISDSSYWVFLVHVLGTLGFGILLFNAPLGALTKMTINVLATTAVCLASYQLFVRRTWIGVLLNGKRTPGIERAPAAGEAAAAP